MRTLSIVTGAASGIGRAAAERLVARGDRVLLLDIDETGGQAAAAALGTSARFVALDLTLDTSIRAAAEQVLGEVAAPRVLVNVAG
jgi:NAD(P)-dependent dehydrogenase (short-subunit alcohol dehydrogenase family)